MAAIDGGCGEILSPLCAGSPCTPTLVFGARRKCARDAWLKPSPPDPPLEKAPSPQAVGDAGQQQPQQPAAAAPWPASAAEVLRAAGAPVAVDGEASLLAGLAEQQQLLAAAARARELQQARRETDRVHDHLRGSRMLPSAVSSWEKGLENPVGFNNCFLNAILQALWHLRPFRRSFAADLAGHTCTERLMRDSCIACALAALFDQYRYGEHPHLPPHVVRQVLSFLFSDRHRFQLGEMDDAAECFEALLYSLHLAISDKPDHCAPRCFVHRTFGLDFMERGQCLQCRANTEPNVYSATVVYVPDKVFAGSSQQHGAPGSLERRINAHLRGPQRSCSQCRAKGTVPFTDTFLLEVPSVFVLGVAWAVDGASSRIPQHELRRFADAIRPRLNISDMVQVPGVSVTRSAPEARRHDPCKDAGTPPRKLASRAYESAEVVPAELSCVVCFYGRHYTCYCRSPELAEKWVHFDDAAVRVVGSMDQLRSSIVANGQQPLLLMYSTDPAELREQPKEQSACAIM